MPNRNVTYDFMGATQAISGICNKMEWPAIEWRKKMQEDSAHLGQKKKNSLGAPGRKGSKERKGREEGEGPIASMHRLLCRGCAAADLSHHRCCLRTRENAFEEVLSLFWTDGRTDVVVEWTDGRTKDAKNCNERS